MNDVMIKPFAYIAHVYDPDFDEDRFCTVYVYLDRDTGKFCGSHCYEKTPQNIIDQAIRQAQKIWELHYGQNE